MLLHTDSPRLRTSACRRTVTAMVAVLTGATMGGLGLATSAMAGDSVSAVPDTTVGSGVETVVVVDSTTTTIAPDAGPATTLAPSTTSPQPETTQSTAIVGPPPPPPQFVAADVPLPETGSRSGLAQGVLALGLLLAGTALIAVTRRRGV